MVNLLSFLSTPLDNEVEHVNAECPHLPNCGIIVSGVESHSPCTLSVMLPYLLLFTSMSYEGPVSLLQSLRTASHSCCIAVTQYLTVLFVKLKHGRENNTIFTFRWFCGNTYAGVRDSVLGIDLSQRSRVVMNRAATTTSSASWCHVAVMLSRGKKSRKDDKSV